MRASATKKLNAFRMMVASRVIRAAYSKHDEFIHRQHQIQPKTQPLNSNISRHSTC